jgi:light-regulated signal transduction histidine kinase (bacteriophytochrome)
LKKSAREFLGTQIADASAFFKSFRSANSFSSHGFEVFEVDASNPPTAFEQNLLLSGLELVSKTNDLPSLFQAVATAVHNLTGHDRVMLYQF